MTENEFDSMLRRRNLWLAIAALTSAIMGTLFLYGALVVHDVMRRGEWTLVYALLLVVLLSNVSTWLCATARRTDLYTIAAGNSLTQLRRYRGEIDNVIEALEGEATA